MSAAMSFGLQSGVRQTSSPLRVPYACLVERLRRLTDASVVPPMTQTLRWVVVMTRLVGWAWWVILVLTAVDRVPRLLAVSAVVLATIGTGATLLAARGDRFLGHPAFVITDGLVTLALAGSAWVAGTEALLSGGYPMSWLFVVAYAARLPWTVAASVALAAWFAFLHGALDLGATRTIGSIQFVVIGLIAGWAFDSLRSREDLRLQAEKALLAEQKQLAIKEDRERTVRLLHDSVLQTLIALQMHADLPSQVRYLARRQEREVRRHIEEYRSPYQRSFKAKLQEACDEVEDTCRVDVESVIRDDAPLDASLDSLTGAAREALFNAAKHSGAKVVHLYSEVSGGWARADIRDRGNGLVGDQRALSDSLSERVAAARGSAVVRSTPDEGTDVMITVPWP